MKNIVLTLVALVGFVSVSFSQAEVDRSLTKKHAHRSPEKIKIQRRSELHSKSVARAQTAHGINYRVKQNPIYLTRAKAPLKERCCPEKVRDLDKIK